MKRISKILWVVCYVICLTSCSGSDDSDPIATTDDDIDITDDMTDDVDDVGDSTGVTVDLDAVPYDTLSEYNFFEGTLAALQPNDRVLEYSLINKLFSDYSIKKRFIWMPEGVTAT